MMGRLTHFLNVDDRRARKNGKSRGWSCAAAFVLAALLLWTAGGNIFAQERVVQRVFVDEKVPQTGLHYYAIEDLTTGQVVQRGSTVVAGDVFDNLILAANTPYRIWVLQAETLWVGDPSLITPDSGFTFTVPDMVLRFSLSPDSDGDGLHDEGEFIVGTNANNRDTDNDGVNDGPEVLQGTNPLDGFPTATEIIGTVDTPGIAVDICAFNERMIVADSGRGVTVFNVFNTMNPIIIAQVDTPGTAERVACSSNLIAVADGNFGLAVIDVSDPPAAAIIHQINLGSYVRSVATAGDIAFVGLTDGRLFMVDMVTGVTLGQVTLPAPVLDLALEGDFLFAITRRDLHSIDLAGIDMTLAGSVAGPQGRDYMRLFVGGAVAYPVTTSGYDTISLADPAAPVVIQATADPQFGWQDIALNGSGLGLAAVGVSPRIDVNLSVSLYDTSDNSVTDRVINRFDTPGAARAVTIFNGLGYVADHMNGMQIVNYVSFDTLEMAPLISLTASFPLAPAQAEEGKRVRVTANVTDDVQVRNVEFMINGVRVATDGNFPFELRFVTPPIADQSAFTLQARASDTGGNFTFTDELVVQLVPDATAPLVRRVIPSEASIQAGVTSVGAFFNEPLDENTVTPQTFTLTEAGRDGVPGGGDDVAISNGTLAWREDIQGATLSFDEPLPSGFYTATASSALADIAGNTLAEPFVWRFRTFSSDDPDRDGDGIPDSVELALGLDPDLIDSDGDGTPDAQEDPDGDGLVNIGEILLGTDPNTADTNGNGILDGDEDTDFDGLSDAGEIAAGTNPFLADSDGDNWPDGVEVEVGSDPLDPSSIPLMTIMAQPNTRIIRPAVGGLPFSVTVASPPTRIIRPTDEAISRGTTVAAPPVSVIRPSSEGADSGTIVAKPPTTVEILPVP